MQDALESGPVPDGLTVTYPRDGAVFPPGIAPPTVRWRDDRPEVDRWLVLVETAEGEARSFASRDPLLRLPEEDWRAIQRSSVAAPARLRVVGARDREPGTLLSGGTTSVATSPDELTAPIFYRDVPLPFIDAVKEPWTIRWRFGPVTAPERPPVVLEGLPVCGNCHSFSRDGRTLGMDIDFGNDKGSYALVDVEPEIVLDRERIMTWSDHRGPEDTPTFGLLSRVSPDGRYVVSTVEDRSVFVVTPGLDFSQLFFPVQGILAVYDRQTGSIRALPGADDPAFVQSDPAWSPDGRTILFARAPAHRLEGLRNPQLALLHPDEAREFTEEGRPFRYELYRIPFEGGRGGTPVPLAGASGDGRSSYFGRYSPDGRWIVFCKADSYMLLQPDAELHIVPAEGGEARRLEANIDGMNSWHSWSPDGRWLVFSAKEGSPWTRLMLTHIDEEGRSSPAVELEGWVPPGRAANIPEFVAAGPGAIRRIRQGFVDGMSHARTGQANLVAGDPDGAIAAFRRALAEEPDDPRLRITLGALLVGRGELEEGELHLREALRLDPNSAEARVNLGAPLLARGELAEAERLLREAVELAPDDPLAWRNLGLLLARSGRGEEAERCRRRWRELEPAPP